MGANKIEVYEGNTLSVTCTVSGIVSLSGYTCLLTVKDRDGNQKFEKTGTAVDLVITFTVTNTDNTITPDEYDYEVTINNGTNYFTVVKDIYSVKESIIY